MPVKRFVKKVIRRADNLIASESTVRAAFYRVRRELKDIGVLTNGINKLDKVRCEREIASKDGLAGVVGYLGFYYPKQYVIRIPAVCSAALNPWLDGRCMSDVLRHEFGHAIYDFYPKLLSDERFKKAFGDEYGENKVSKEGDERDYVSAYARTYTQEDFAETFMLFVKHKGILPREFSRRKATRLKWETVKAICEDIKAEAAKASARASRRKAAAS